MINRTAARLTVVCVFAAATLAISALPAAAHVTVQPATAEQGGFAALSFRVPTERPDASTVKLEVVFPIDQPLAFLSVRPHPGWTYRVEKTTLPEPVQLEDREITESVSKITWTATSPATAIKPGEYDEFSVSAGFLPEDDQMVFKALQTYSSGEVVRWIEEAAEGAAEPERPAPVLRLTEPADDEAAAAPASNAGDSNATGADPAGSDAPSRAVVNAALGLGAVGLLVGLVSAFLALSARRRWPAAGSRTT